MRRNLRDPRDPIFEAIHDAHDKATVCEAQRMVMEWLEAHPQDSIIPGAAESLALKAALLEMN